MSPIISLVFRSDAFGLHIHMLEKRIYRDDRWLTANIRLCLSKFIQHLPARITEQRYF
jgi:hypothetical protein